MTIFKLWGVKVKVNLLFIVVIFLFLLIGELPRVLIAFFCVLVHEIGHILTARQYGLKTTQIEFLPFGGVAVFEDMLQLDPKAELKVALAGPAVNFVLVLVTTLLTRYDLLNLHLALFFITYNLYIGIFNLIPAFPLDGGRVLRAILAQIKNYWQATDLTLKVTRLFAILLGLGAVVSWIMNRASLITLLGAFFVYYAALKEKEQSIFVLIKYLTRKKLQISKDGYLPLEQFIVSADINLLRVLKTINPGTFAQFLIYDKDYQLMGIITEIEVLETFFEEGKNVPIKLLLTAK